MNDIRKLFFLLVVFFMQSCTGGQPARNEVVVHEIADPEMLNPCNTVDANSIYILSNIFQKLIDFDFKNPTELVPILAETRPQIEKTADGKMFLTFQIRKEATWDNHTPVTAKDVEFSIKTIKNPLVNNPDAKPFFTFINDFIFYPDDIRKFTVVSNEIYFLAEASFSDISILPEYLYDPKGLLRNFTVKMLSEKPDSLKNNSSIKEFADDFNSEKRMRDPNFIGGSGPYKLSDWKTNERVTLTKKEDWWGSALSGKNCYFDAYLNKLIFQTVKDQTTALVSLKAGNLDVMHGIKAKDFIDLKNSEKFTENFFGYTPEEYSYIFIGLNMKRPLLADKLTRQALAHLVNIDEIIKTVKYGEAVPVIGPIHPSKKNVYNYNIQPYNYDLNKAKELLEKAGWKNSNGDETLDKVINGKRTEFILDFILGAGNEERKSIALMFREEAKKVGIAVNITTLDWGVYLEKCRNHEFDLTISKWIFGPGDDDLKQTFNSEAASNGGSNYSNFSNALADALMDSIRTEINENKRNRMYLQLQEIFHEEVPMIFLYAPTEHIAISKKFENAYPSVIHPGYWLQGFKVKELSN